jgi:hypothetical protein
MLIGAHPWARFIIVMFWKKLLARLVTAMLFVYTAYAASAASVVVANQSEVGNNSVSSM